MTSKAPTLLEYECSKCKFRTKAFSTATEVMHNCPKTKTLRTMKEVPK